ncbi:hypothetical protein [Maricaulis parjimensis]|uniref:hypothetical protein n=1 Tax=Maricaulis parjimensis TaxID=144023 RepID=UPI001939B899|nr:hypothetical protein [Maricaulis parjimensis]
MRDLLPSLAALLLILTSQGPAIAQTRVPVNEIIELEFDAETPTRVRVQLDAAALLRFDVFAGDEAITAVRIAQPGDTDETKQLTEFLVLGPGRHDLELVANGGSDPVAGRIQGRISAGPPNDAFEPNDRPDEAVEIDLPFNRIVRLSQNDWDWFQVDPPRSGVLGIQLHAWRSAYPGPLIRVESLDGELLYASPNSPGGWNGMRYVNVTSAPVRIGVNDTNNWPENQWHGYKALEIVLIEPLGGMRGQLITLGLEGGDAGWLQLAEIGNALGTELREANEAEAVSTELLRAVEGQSESGPGLLVWLLGGLGVLVLGGGGFWAWRRFRPANSSDDAA